MPSHHERRLSAYRHDQLMDLVLDVEKYPQFLPWCLNARILTTESSDVFTAELLIGYRRISQSYVSKIVADRDNKRIDVTSIRGSLQHLQNVWTFHPQEQGTIIEFEISFGFRSLLVSRLMDAFFHRGAIAMVEAFEKRADQLYQNKIR